MTERKESDLVRACLAYLKSRDVMAWRVNSGAWKVGDRFVRFGERGSADIHGVLQGGRFLAVECKVGKNKPTEAQKTWLLNVERHGGLAFIVWSVDELGFRLKQLGVLNESNRLQVRNRAISAITWSSVGGKDMMNWSGQVGIK